MPLVAESTAIKSKNFIAVTPWDLKYTEHPLQIMITIRTHRTPQITKKMSFS